MFLTPHFTLEELTASAEAKARGLKNTPTQCIYESSRKIVHLGFGLRLRRQALTQRRGPGTSFIPGIVP